LTKKKKGITGNERADEAAKNALEENINDRKLDPPQDLINWIIPWNMNKDYVWKFKNKSQ
jgi:hypothetical protein